MSRRLTRFELCAGWDGVCPWKQAGGLPLDTEGACPLCNAERLQHELGVRHGQDLTSALRRIKEVSEETYALALERLDRFVSADVMEDFKGRVTRAKHRKTLAAAAPKKRPAAAAPRATRMIVHRVGSVSADGRAVVREGDPADELEIEDENETVAEAISRLMTAQGSEADLPNWTVKAMEEDKVIREISPDTTPASGCPRIVLVRKGG